MFSIKYNKKCARINYLHPLQLYIIERTVMTQEVYILVMV